MRKCLIILQNRCFIFQYSFEFEMKILPINYGLEAELRNKPILITT